MKQNEFRAELVINTRNDTPNVITDLINIQPTKHFRKGEQWYSPHSKKPIPNKVNENNIWIYSTDKKYGKEGVYLNESIQELLDFLEGSKLALKSALKTYPSSYFVCYATYYDSHEYFQLDSLLIEKINYYGIKIVFDSYNLTEN